MCLLRPLALHVCISHPTVSYTDALQDSQADLTAVLATALHGTALGRSSERVPGSALGPAALKRALGKAAESALALLPLILLILIGLLVVALKLLTLSLPLSSDCQSAEWVLWMPGQCH